MYLQNKYTRWYYNIIQRAQSRILPADVYTEKHHIIPSSLGGSNSISNIASLTSREHFICHLLLTKMTTGNNLLQLNVSWEKVKYSLLHREDFETYSKQSLNRA